ncbi:hypothetical protein CYMTET_22711 [Cymbomonas tetramitiformis]|uniref:Transmembrane protein n=1 Tax=Cymbomonas tetramitiformis TaxID=36881 RepID=A0AAE0L1X5_9CHLO|nr:hypothetical protein CYMTET_22711 [Cymbomonas tetramitiformis]
MTQVTNISSCSFHRNSANGTGTGSGTTRTGNGGVMYLQAEAGWSRDRTHLEALGFYGNSAREGGAIGYWAPVDLQAMPVAPACVSCEPLDGSNVAAYGSSEGWATKALHLQVAEQQQEEASNEKVAHNISVRITDANGEIVVVDSSTMVEIHFNNSDVCQLEEGSTRVQAVRGVATFSGSASSLKLRGNPGTLCLVYFSADFGYEAEVVTNITVVPLRYCLPGEELKGDSPWKYCAECEEGKLSLSNASGCVECFQELGCEEGSCPIECLGGDRFVPRRMGRGAGSVAELRLCDGVSYTGDSVVLCGGKKPVTCSGNHFPVALRDRCIACPGRNITLLRAVFVSVGAAIGVSLVVLLFTTVSESREQVMSGKVQDTSVQLLKARHALSLVVGYAQVMGQMSHVFSADLLPSMATSLMSWLFVFNMDFVAIINFKCFSHYFLTDVNSSFYFGFWQSVLLPWALCAMFAVLYLLLLLQHRTRQHKQLQQAREAGKEPDERATHQAELEQGEEEEEEKKPGV